jgi:hypothetical protein
MLKFIRKTIQVGVTLAVLAPQNGHEVKGGGTVDYDLDAQLRRAEEFHATDN